MLFIQNFKPYNTQYWNRLETFNEACILILINIGLCFSQAIANSITRYTFGYLFVAFNGLLLVVHAVLILRSSLSNCKLLFKKYHYKYTQYKLNKKQVAKQKMHPQEI